MFFSVLLEQVFIKKKLSFIYRKINKFSQNMGYFEMLNYFLGSVSLAKILLP